MLCYLVGSASMLVGSYDQARKVKRSAINEDEEEDVKCYAKEM